ncbi:hypothetical protein ABIA16_003778 [Sinorhizobium fredii]
MGRRADQRFYRKRRADFLSSKATLDASLAYAANTMAWVIGDATVANNGIYQKSGASGAGSWTRVSDLPFSFIIASDVGAGAPNAIQATTSIPVSGSALVWMNIFEANTASPVTVSFNGGSVLIIKTNAGNDVAIGGLTAGAIVMGIVSGSTFRLVSDQASSAVLAAAEAAQAAAEAAQAAAEAAAAGVNLPPLQADTMLVDNGSARVATPQIGVREFLGLGVGPLRNPQITPMLIDYDQHYGLNTCLFPRTDGGLTVVTRKSDRHVGDNDAQIVAWETYDNGLSRANMRLIYDGATTDDRNFASAPMGSRFGIIALRTSDTPIFIYSDDQGQTWPAVALTLDAGLPVGYASSPHGKIMRWPASAGGHDTTGWIVYFYSSEVIAYATTIDNGNTWSAVTPCIVGTGQLPTEMAVARVGVEDKWFMVIRKEVLGSDALVATSTNMTTWSALSTSGIELSKNPPYLVQDDDATWLYAAIRKTAEITGIPGNTVVVTKIDASAFYNSAGASGFGDWRVIAQLPDWGTGYMDFVEYHGEWIAAINAGELSLGSATNGGASALYMMSNTPAAQGLALLQAVSQKSALLNSCFQVWQSGTTGAGAAGRVLTADGWGLRRANSVTGHEWSRQTGTDGGYALRVQRTAGNAATNLINLINVINSDDVRSLRGKHCNISIRARRGADYSEANSQLFVDVYGETTESQITATDGTSATGTALEQFNVVLDSGGRWTESNSQVFIPDNVEMVWVRLRYTAVGTAGAADYFDLDEVVLQPTPYKAQLSMRSYGEELALCQRYFCKTYASSTAAGTVTTAGALQNRARGTETLAAVNMDWRFPVEMRAAPTITVYSPVTGASGKVADITATADINGTAECVGRSGATLVNNAATVSGNTYRAHAAASALPW